MTTANEEPRSAGEQFERLLRGYATVTLTVQEREHLRTLSAGEPGRTRAVAAFDRLHAEFARERSLSAAAAVPTDPAEEADEGFVRLAAAGARAEAELRSKLLHAPAPSLVRPQRPVRRVLFAVAAALAAGVLLAFWLGAFDAPPALHSGVPDPRVAGGDGKSIVIAPRLSAVDRSVSWSPLWHAHGYEVVIVDGRGNVVLQRATEQARSTRWELTIAEFEQLRARQQELRLRVRALDGSGLPVGTSGDLPLTIQ